MFEIPPALGAVPMSRGRHPLIAECFALLFSLKRILVFSGVWPLPSNHITVNLLELEEPRLRRAAINPVCMSRG